MPGGGMERLRSFTMTFSHVSAELATWSASASSSIMLAVFSFWLWQGTQYCVTSARAGVAGGAGAWNPKAIQETQTYPIRTLYIVILLLTTTLILGLAGVSELRVRVVLEQQIRPFLVIENATQPVALSRGREPRCHAGLADHIHIHPQIDQLRKQRVPSAVRRTEQSVFAEGRHALRVDACIQQKLDRR